MPQWLYPRNLSSGGTGRGRGRANRSCLVRGRRAVCWAGDGGGAYIGREGGGAEGYSGWSWPQSPARSHQQKWLWWPCELMQCPQRLVLYCGLVGSRRWRSPGGTDTVQESSHNGPSFPSSCPSGSIRMCMCVFPTIPAAMLSLLTQRWWSRISRN